MLSKWKQVSSGNNYRQDTNFKNSACLARLSGSENRRIDELYLASKCAKVFRLSGSCPALALLLLALSGLSWPWKKRNIFWLISWKPGQFFCPAHVVSMSGSMNGNLSGTRPSSGSVRLQIFVRGYVVKKSRSRVLKASVERVSTDTNNQHNNWVSANVQSNTRSTCWLTSMNELPVVGSLCLRTDF